jgi:HSP20 family protein
MPENDDKQKKLAGKQKGEDASIGKLGLNTLLQGVGNLIDFVARMEEEARKEEQGTREFTSPSGRVKGIFNFSVKTGIAEKLATEFSGNKENVVQPATVEPDKQPIVDVFNEQDYVLVLIELPELNEKEIHIDVKGDILRFWSTGEQQNITKEVILPQEVDEHTLNSKYKHGILEIRMSKKQHD